MNRERLGQIPLIRTLLNRHRGIPEQNSPIGDNQSFRKEKQDSYLRENQKLWEEINPLTQAISELILAEGEKYREGKSITFFLPDGRAGFAHLRFPGIRGSIEVERDRGLKALSILYQATDDGQFGVEIIADLEKHEFLRYRFYIGPNINARFVNLDWPIIDPIQMYNMLSEYKNVLEETGRALEILPSFPASPIYPNNIVNLFDRKKAT